MSIEYWPKGRFYGFGLRGFHYKAVFLVLLKDKYFLPYFSRPFRDLVFFSGFWKANPRDLLGLWGDSTHQRNPKPILPAKTPNHPNKPFSTGLYQKKKPLKTPTSFSFCQQGVL